MPTDDELVELLARTLDDDGPSTPPPDRIAAFRDQVEAARLTSGATSDRGVQLSGGDSVGPSLDPSQDSVSRRLGARGWLSIAASLLVALVVGFGVARAIDGDGDDSVAGDVEFDGTMTGPSDDSADAELTVVATGIGRVVDLRTGALPILPVGEYYQVWFVGPGDTLETPNRISAGTFHPDTDGRSDVQFAAAVDPDLYPIVEITAEPGDGNPLATGPLVLRAEIPASL